jgi:flavodoxin
MKTCLVVYYSRTGITQEVAQRIAAECACDIEPIRDMRSRRGVAGYVRCCHEAFSHKTPAIAPMSRHPGDYELVILGAPVWVGRLSAPMRTYLHANAGRLPRVAAFCTMGGSGGDRALDDIAALCGRPLCARLALTDREIKTGQDADRIGRFIRAALAAASRPVA